MQEVTVQILMGVHEGGDHLETQLQSFADQTHADWILLASDDSATDDSRARIERFGAATPHPVQLFEGPRQGFAANYLSLIPRAAPGWLAFSDQDDLWLPDKLARAVALLAAEPMDQPALYCARSTVWDGRVTHSSSPALPRAPGFQNALIENIAQGNTILLNPAATALAQAAGPRVDRVFAHDWWLYLLISGAGGRIVFDPGDPVVLYRQHAGNAIGAGRGLRAQIARKTAVLRGAFAERLALNLAALEGCRDLLTPDNAILLDRFSKGRTQGLPARVAALRQLGLYRQRPLGTLGFWGAALLGRI